VTADDYALTPPAAKDSRDNSTRTSRMLAISRMFSRFRGCRSVVDTPRGL